MLSMIYFLFQCFGSPLKVINHWHTGTKQILWERIIMFKISSGPPPLEHSNRKKFFLKKYIQEIYHLCCLICKFLYIYIWCKQKHSHQSEVITFVLKIYISWCSSGEQTTSLSWMIPALWFRFILRNIQNIFSLL
jgi:hypothetical protein